MGDTVWIFDGLGNEIDARIVQINSRSTELSLGERRRAPAERGAAGLTLLQGLARGEKMDVVIQKTTELGVQRIVPVLMNRSVVRATESGGGGRLRRWRAIAEQAARQSGRAAVPEIAAPQKLEDALRVVDSGSLRFALWEQVVGRSLRVALAAAAPEQPIALLVGPEGGLTTGEVEMVVAAGFDAVGLGPRILRTETAAIVAVALAQAARGALD